MPSFLKAVVVTGILLATLCLMAVAFLMKQASAEEAQTMPQGCARWETMRDGLADKFGEEAAHLAVTDSGAVVVVTINPKTGSWSLIMMPNAEIACLAIGGDGWEAAPDTLKPGPRT